MLIQWSGQSEVVCVLCANRPMHRSQLHDFPDQSAEVLAPWQWESRPRQQLKLMCCQGQHRQTEPPNKQIREPHTNHQHLKAENNLHMYDMRRTTRKRESKREEGGISQCARRLKSGLESKWQRTDIQIKQITWWCNVKMMHHYVNTMTK